MEGRRPEARRKFLRRGLHAGRRRPKGRRADEEDEDEADEHDLRSGGCHWYVISLSIVLVIGLSFVNFLALPRMPYHFGDLEVATAARLRGEVAKPLRLEAAAPQSSPAAPGGAPSGAGAAPPLAAQGKRIGAALGEPARADAMGDARGGRPTAGAPPATPASKVSASPGIAGLLGNLVGAATGAATAALAPPPATQVAVTAGGGVALFDGGKWLELKRDLDNDEVALGAWLFLPKVPDYSFPPSSASMKTVAATKVSGCKADLPETHGWALFVHEWGTTNRQLRLSWTDLASACHELYSDTLLVPFDRWVHVGFSLSKSQDRAVLYLDGAVAADTRMKLGAYAKQGQQLDVSHAAVERRTLHAARQESHGLIVGGHLQQGKDSKARQSHLFIGYLGDVKVLHGVQQDPARTAELLRESKAGLSRGLAAHVVFQQGVPPKDKVSGSQLEAPAGTVEVEAWVENPVHPYLRSEVPETPTLPPEPGTTMGPTDLRATWPKAWTDHFSEEALAASQKEADPWADEVRDAMRHTWQGYRAKAWGRDDIKPDTGGGTDWCRMATTMLDALSTLWVMGLGAEFDDAADWLERNQLPAPGKHGMHSLFEITIRALGGLLSAYSLSGRDVFLKTAVRTANTLLPSFETNSGIPKNTVDIGTGEAKWHTWSKNAVLAEVTTVQVEFRYLSHVTGERKYQVTGDRAMAAVFTAGAKDRGLVPIYMSRDDQTPKFVGNKLSLGAMGDSYYEYLLKQYIQNGQKDAHLLEAWKRAMKEMQSTLIKKTAGGLTYVAESSNNRIRPRMDHLACFVAGMLMLGARALPHWHVDPAWEPLAHSITLTCYEMYKRSPTGVSPEYVSFNDKVTQGDMLIPNDAPHNLLRPEAAEAVYYMHYYTGDPKWRRMAYEMWTPFQKHCKAKYGYSSIADVRRIPAKHKDSQESFWLAETLKYFYLIFAPRNALNLEEFVLNTEAQPLRMWKETADTKPEGKPN